MEINVTTDFNVGDTIHYMRNNKPTFGKVRSIDAHCTSEEEIRVSYTTEQHDYISTDKAFSNPYDLRDALFSEVEELK